MSLLEKLKNTFIKDNSNCFDTVEDAIEVIKNGGMV